MTTKITNKWIKSLFVIHFSLFISVALTSCLDTIILPDDKTVDEDFWKTKEDVASMVNAAYAGLVNEDVMTRLIVWGGFRSDELVKGAVATGAIPDALEEIAAVNMQVTNTFATWAPFYSVINRCNIVLERAEAVMEEDPNYTESDFQSDRCQMLALRSLCYFYLVRNFRDVPYTTEAFMNSSQEMQIGQSSPEYVLGQLIETLEQVIANPSCLRSNSYTINEWRRVGWMTRDGVLSLLADIYLWRASVLHSQADYQRCIDICEEVIASKRQQHVQGRNELELKAYPLEDGNRAYGNIFGDQNAEESIFELQVAKDNPALCKYLYKYGSNSSAEGYLKASPIFSSSAGAPNQITNSNVFAAQDLRYYSATFTSSEEVHDVCKMVSSNSIGSKTQPTRASADRTYGSFDQNYIVYRLSDIMLMEAEALNQLLRDVDANASEDETKEAEAFNDSLKQQMFNLVEAVNTRSLQQDDVSSYAMKWDTYKAYTKGAWETYILQERLRELCFEGKRWYDLLRFNYRHTEGVQYNRTLGELIDDAEAANTDVMLPSIFDDMLALATRGRPSEAQAIKAKMRNEAYLYLPIPNSDINVCPLLRQNPAYKSGNTYEKNY
ncbi:MAG: RagB/SusD family nutrient uptake outer membrane protein [Prevotella sp.]|nr:RagB/SusD family nutrient uptake outer membrane protein [Prevotella sp.]